MLVFVFKRFRGGLLLLLYSLLFGYLILELPLSLWKWGRVSFYDDYLLWELPRNIKFDPVMGFRVLSSPIRHARMAGGVVQYNGVWKGNNLGFLSARNYYPKRFSSKLRRVLVLGDSFSGGRFNDVLWPERVEELAKGDGIDVELLNFSMSTVS